ncbi:MAG: hypothetical protein IPO15_25840 [Anaerolineae bacterium]|uniref:hypothetical protein n=1 Tax=Candidatus Amarolinea dominans TaxID=3140696 RepID=UPI0031361F70|nr:hypothetical protein [Anaerolineae bacterium]
MPGTTIPNNTWGHGEINVLAAVQAAQPTALTVSGLDAQTLPGNALLVVMAARCPGAAERAGMACASPPHRLS